MSVDIEFVVTRKSKTRRTDAFGKTVGTVCEKRVCAWRGRLHKDVTVRGRQVITDDGDVIHDQGTHAQAVTAAKEYLRRQFTGRGA